MILDAERAFKPFLVYRTGDGELVVRQLAGTRILIGRSGSSDLVFDWDESVSRIHAELTRIAESWVVSDDGLSSNGTFVGSQRVSGRKVLNDGDVLRLGSTMCVFRDPTNSTIAGTTLSSELIPAPELTGAQLRVLAALCRPVLSQHGATTSPATNQEIADELYLSIDAVKGHLRVLFSKFGVSELAQNRKRSALVNKAIESGVVGPSTMF